MIRIRRALLSVHDKTGIIPFAKALNSFGCEIISTGGTGKVLTDAGLTITDISAVTGNPEAFGGRMKTISFPIGASLLFDRERDAVEARNLDIVPIDLVVCTLYPFERVWKQKHDFDTLIENIDIGGVTMIRAAAKNFKFVTVVTDTADYGPILRELTASGGSIGPDTRRNLMRKAFNHVAEYDSVIAVAMDETCGTRSMRMSFTAGEALRYGENAHQKAWLYRQTGSEPQPLNVECLQGKELSFNNHIDIREAAAAVRALSQHGCAVVKHANICGLCEAGTQTKALEYAWNGDPVSAFGSIIAFNEPLSLETLKFLNLEHEDRNMRKFVEVIVAPSFQPDALGYLKNAKNLRAVEFPFDSRPHPMEYRFFDGILLAQECDTASMTALETKTQRPLGRHVEGLVKFGINAVRRLKSNAIAIVRSCGGGYFQLLGMGSGRPNRISSVLLAIGKCRENLTAEAEKSGFPVERHIADELGKAILVSDGFFPFPDVAKECAAAGIRTIVQPGGSLRDAEVIEACNRHDIAMAFSGIRHFKH